MKKTRSPRVMSSIVEHDAAYVFPWKTLMKMMTENYYPRNEIKKLETELWNLLARSLMDQKLLTYVARQSKNKRRLDNDSRNNNAQQPPNKRQNVARAYTAGSGEKREYDGTLPLCNKCKFHHNGSCAAKCTNYKRVGHLARDCRSPTDFNTHRAPGTVQKKTKNSEARRRAYALEEDEDIHDLISVETEFPSIVFNDNLTSNETPSCEPTASSLNGNEIDFRISFDEFDDEDYTVIFDKNSFSYKIISANDLKTDSENDNEKVNMPSFPSPEPTVSCLNDLDFFKDFENEFTAIVYNDALTSKSDFLTEPTLNPQHIDEFDLKDETSLSKYDEVEQNVLYFNDIFPFNIIYPDDLKLVKDNDDNEIDMIQSLGDMAPLQPHEQRYPFFRYQGLEYYDQDIANFKERMLMKHRDDDRVMLFTSQAWGRVFETRGPLVRELILEFLSTLRFGEVLLDLDTPNTIQFRLGGARRRMSWRDFILALRDISTNGDFLGPPLSYTLIRDLVMRLCHRMMAQSISGISEAPEKRRFAAGRKSGALISGPTRQEGDAGRAAEEASIAPGGGDEDEEMPQAMPPPPKTQSERIARLEEEVHGMREAGVTYTRYSELPVEYQRRSVGQRTDEPSTLLKLRVELRRKRRRCKEIDDVGEVSTIWKSVSVGVLKLQDGCSTQILLNKSTWKIYLAKYQGSFSF
ncbi:hypothetical protein Tco_0540155 [Tanacetum coccineum]